MLQMQLLFPHKVDSPLLWRGMSKPKTRQLSCIDLADDLLGALCVHRADVAGERDVSQAARDRDVLRDGDVADRRQRPGRVHQPPPALQVWQHICSEVIKRSSLSGSNATDAVSPPWRLIPSLIC